jgi:hypothetical protein
VIRHLVSFTIVLLLTASLASAITRVAVLAPTGSAAEKMSSLLEVTLAADAGVQMVDRQQLAAVLREQQLSACFSPEDPSARLKLGRLARADMLVVLREQQTPTYHLQIVVFESRQGLRLLVEPAALTNDFDADAHRLGQIIISAIRKLEEGITSIVAVPDFACDDLTHEFADAGAAYASVVEQSLLKRKGVVVVEIAEAQAIAREMAVGGSVGIDRRLPYILLGNYSNSGLPKARIQAVHLALKQGEAQVAELAKPNIEPADLVATLVDQTDQLVGSKLAKRSSLPDSDADARQLQQRGAEFLNAGEYRQGLALCDASLLLKSTYRAHRDAAFGDLAICLAERAADRQLISATDTDSQMPADSQARFQEGLDHVEAWMKLSRLTHLAPADTVFQRYRVNCAPEQFARLLIRVAQAKFEAGVSDDIFRDAADVRWDLITPPSTRFSLAVQLAKFAQKPTDAIWMTAIFRQGTGLDKSPECSVIIGELSASDNPITRAIATAVEHPSDASPAAKLQGSARSPATQPVAHPAIKLVPLDIGLQQVFGCIPAGNDLDLFWGANSDPCPALVRAVPVRGDPKTLCKTIRGSTPAFDGKYVWTAVEGSDRPEVLAIDPAEPDSFMTIGPKDGLPNEKICGFAAAPLAPGRICAAIAIGSPDDCRSYIAILCCKPATGRKVIVLHTEKLSPLAPGIDRFDPHVSFLPRTAERLSFAGPGAAPSAIVSFPACAGRQLVTFPTADSLQTGDGVIVTKDPALSGTFVYQGKIYGTRRLSGSPHNVILFSATFGDGGSVAINPDAAAGPLAVTDHGCFIFNSVEQCLYFAETPQQSFRQLKTTIPIGYFKMAENAICLSNQFGVLLLNSKNLYQFQSDAGTPLVWK